MPKLISQKNFSNIKVLSLTTSSTDQAVLDVFSKETFRSAKYQIQVSNGNSYRTSELIVVHDGSNTYNTEYGIIRVGDDLASFDTDISGNNVRLLTSPIFSSSTTFKVIRTSINT
jgi:hypothetical protein